MTYKEEFLEAFCARKKYLPDAKPEKFLNYKDFNSFRASEDEARAYSFFEKIDSYFEQVLLPDRQKFNLPIANACHVISHDLLRGMLHYKCCQPNELALTIGNVAVDNQWIYDITEESLKKTLADGVVVDQDLNVHVWLTYRSNYVFDPTILYTLVELGCPYLNPEEYLGVFIWNREDEEKKWHVDYKPMFVDSDFFLRVDKIQGFIY